MKSRTTNERLRRITAFICFLFTCLLAGCTGAKKTHSEKPVSKAKTQAALLSTPFVLGNIGYNTKTGIINVPARITTVAFSPDARYVACMSRVEVIKGGADSKPGIVHTEHADDEMPPNILARRFVIIFEMATGVAKLQFMTEAIVNSLAFSADSQMLFVGCEAHSVEDRYEDRKGYLQVWDVRQGKMLRNIETGAYHMAVAPTGHMLALAREESPGNPSTITVLDTKSWHVLHRFTSILDISDLDDIAFSADGHWLSVAYSAEEHWAGEVWIWDTRSRKRILRINDDFSPQLLRGIEKPLAITIPTDKQSNGYIYCGSTRFKVKYAGEQLKMLEKSSTLSKHSEDVRAIESFNPKRAVSRNNEGDSLSLWDINSQKIVASWKIDGYSRLKYSPDGKFLAVISEDKTCRVIRLPS